MKKSTPIILIPPFVLGLLVVFWPTTFEANAQSSKLIHTTVLDVPAGRYVAIVFAGIGTSANTTAFAKIRTGKEVFDVPVAPGVTTAIPFGEGWTVQDRKVTIEIESSTGNPASTGVSVWGTTTNGPVKFPEHER